MGHKILVVFTLLFFLFLGFFYKDNIFSTRFIDEEENFAIGRYLTKGQKLYDDILTSHQPLNYIFSSKVQSFSNPKDAYFLIRDHRLAVLGWSAVWGLLLVYLFGVSAFLFILIFETSKSFIFGNLFLPETFSVYPLTYLIASFIYKKQNLFLTGACIALCTFLFQPLWPLMLFLTALVIFQNIKKPKVFLYFFAGVLTIVTPILFYISVPGYFQTLLINSSYTIPNYYNSYYRIPIFQLILKSFSSPILGFMNPTGSTTGIIINLISILFILNSFYLLIKKQYFILLTIITVLGLTNLRFVNPGNESFAAGILPWYGSFILVTIILAVKNIKTLKMLNIILITIIVFTTLKLGGVNIAQQNNPQLDYSVNFSTYADRGQAINIMKEGKDTLFVSPDNWLIYWASDTNHLPKLFGYYPWMSGIPKIEQAVLSTFEKNPPTFFYCENCKGLSIEKYLAKYTNLKKNNESTFLFILSEKVENLSEDKIRNLRDQQFNF